MEQHPDSPPPKPLVWRRTLITAAAGVLAFLLVAATAFQDNLFRWWSDPHRPFQTTQPPPEPDYADDRAWALRPPTTDTGAAIFFVHPTTYWGRTAWNAAIDHPSAAERLRLHVLPAYAGAFRTLGDLWAPHYRQAALFATLTTSRYDAREARRLAAADVSAAFRQFLTDAPPDSPIILAGVEQGGLHALAVLAEIADDPAITDRIAAVYVIDQAVPLDVFATGQLGSFGPCREQADTGCIVAWGAVRADHEREVVRFKERSVMWTQEGRLEPTLGRRLLCVNPVYGRQTEDPAFRRLHRGGVNASGLAMDETPPIRPHETSAQCLDGVLLTERPDSTALRDPWRWGGRFKQPLANVFYADTQADAARRLEAFGRQ